MSSFSYGLLTLSAVVAVMTILGGCGGRRCPEESDIEKAVVYRTVDYNADGSHRFDRPVNAWAHSPEMAAFVRRELRAGGLDALQRKHGFRCVPRPVDEECNDCHTCTATVPYKAVSAVLISLDCRHLSDQLVRVDIGNGDVVRAMTFWRR